MKLHEVVAAFMREYLLHDLHRRSKEVREIHERAVTYLQTRRLEPEKTLPTLEARLADERWTLAVLGLTHHGFWLDEEQGWTTLLPTLIGGLAYDRGFARALIETAESLAATFSQAGRRRLKALQNGLGQTHGLSFSLPELSLPSWFGGPKVEDEEVLLTELEASARTWADDGCVAERRAILDLRRGHLLYRREQYAEALAQHEQVERNLPETGEALRRQLGEALYELVGRFMWPTGRSDAVYSPEAEGILRKVVTWLPEKPGAWYRLGGTLDRANKPDEAIAAFQRAIDLNPKVAYPHNGLGNVYHSLGRHDEAIAAFQRAIDLDPKDAAPCNGLGNLYADLGRHDEAIAAYQRAIDLDPKVAYPHNGLGNVYQSLGHIGGARAGYRR
jgi:tetratricopeptide (TPR) repeat protein